MSGSNRFFLYLVTNSVDIISQSLVMLVCRFFRVRVALWSCMIASISWLVTGNNTISIEQTTGLLGLDVLFTLVFYCFLGNPLLLERLFYTAYNTAITWHFVLKFWNPI